MPSTFIFGCPKLKLSFCGIPFLKSIVNGDVVLDKLRERYKSFIPSKDVESYTLKGKLLTGVLLGSLGFQDF